jgi:hypothetical protein
MKEIIRSKNAINTTKQIITINKAAANTKGDHMDREKERYYYIYPAPPKN